MHQPQRVENAKILIANTPMDTDKIKVFGSRVKVDNVSKVAEIELAEKEKMKDKVGFLLIIFCSDTSLHQVDLICAHDMNVFINRQLIYNYPEQLFADRWAILEKVSHLLSSLKLVHQSQPLSSQRCDGDRAR